MKAILLLLSLTILQACSAKSVQESTPVPSAHSTSSDNSSSNNNSSNNTSVPLIRNALPACLSIQAGGQELKQGQWEQVLHIDLQQAIGDCGCTSAQVSVYSDKSSSFSIQSNPPVLPLAQTKLSVLASGEYRVTLLPQTTEQSLTQISVKDFVLSVNCRAPR